MIKLSTSKYLLDTSREYAVYTADTRGIPSVIDGLKTSQRIALWLLRNKAGKVKTVGLAGQMAADKLYVHGDASAQGAINLLAAPYKNNVPLIQGEGEFGSRIKPDGIGAARYTEVMRSKAAELCLYADLPNVPLMKNYDGSNMMPRHFLPLVPLVLLNGIVGVAVGYSTNILPRALKDIVKATQDVLEGREPKFLMPTWSMYDVDVRNIGPNQYEIEGKAEIKDTSTIRVTELPPGLSLDSFRKRLIQMEDEGSKGGQNQMVVMDFDDHSAETINVEVRVKRGALAARAATTETEVIDGKTYKHKVPARKAWTSKDAISFLKLREKVTERIVVLDWDEVSIRSYENPIDLIKDFVAWRLGIYVERYKRMQSEAEYELIYWKMLKALFEGGFTKKLGTFAGKPEVLAEIKTVANKAKLTPDDDQIERAAGLPTYRWTKDFKATIEQRIKELEADIKEFKANLKDPKRIKAIYATELEELKKLK